MVQNSRQHLCTFPLYEKIQIDIPSVADKAKLTVTIKV